MVGWAAELCVGSQQRVYVQTVNYAADKANRVVIRNIFAHIRRKKNRLALIVRFKL